jgi:beta-hydroxyacyl-ACP dehydratase FabZ
MKDEALTQYDVPESKNSDFIIDYAGVLKLLPHRYPFLFIDGVITYEKGQNIAGQKNFSFNEEFFKGHFPQEPVVPGVVQIEALAQISCILVALSEDVQGKRPAFTGIEAAKFRKPVHPGDVLILKSELVKMRRGIAVLNTRAELRGELAAEAVIKAAMV